MKSNKHKNKIILGGESSISKLFEQLCDRLFPSESTREKLINQFNKSFRVVRPVTQNCSSASVAGFFRSKEKETGWVKNELALGKPGDQTNDTMLKRVFWVTRLFGYFFGNEKSNILLTD